MTASGNLEPFFKSIVFLGKAVEYNLFLKCYQGGDRLLKLNCLNMRPALVKFNFQESLDSFLQNVESFWDGYLETVTPEHLVVIGITIDEKTEKLRGRHRYGKIEAVSHFCDRCSFLDEKSFLSRALWTLLMDQSY